MLIQIPATTDSNGDRIKEMHVSFEQKIKYCLDNKSVHFLHKCKRNKGEESEVAITSDIRLDLKKYHQVFWGGYHGSHSDEGSRL